MSTSDLFGLAKEHPYIIAVALFVTLSVGAVGATIYIGASEARIGSREERVSLMDERLKLQEEHTKKQRRINKIVQDQMFGLKKGFESLPEAVSSVHGAVKESKILNTAKNPLRKKLSTSLDDLDKQVLVLQTAVRSIEAMSQALDVLVSGINLEESGNFSKAYENYVKAASAGVPEAYNRVGLLSFTGRGVAQDKEAAISNWEKAALLGSSEAKERLAVMYATGDQVPKDLARAAAILAVEPKLESDNPLIRDALLDRYLSSHSQFSARTTAITASYQEAQRKLLDR